MGKFTSTGYYGYIDTPNYYTMYITNQLRLAAFSSNNINSTIVYLALCTFKVNSANSKICDITIDSTHFNVICDRYNCAVQFYKGRALSEWSNLCNVRTISL